MRLIIAAVVLGLVPSVFAQSVQDKLAAKDELNAGVQSFKAEKYEEAAEHFQKSVSLDPMLLNARLYLATSYMQMYIPGSEEPENIELADKAIEEFDRVLQYDPKNVTSIKGIASLYFNLRKVEEAKGYYERAIEADANDPEAYYSVGVMDWTMAYKFRMNERAEIGLQPTESAINSNICSIVRAQNWDLVKDGIEMLDKALKIRLDYDDAMAYMNLMYRERADMQCGDQSARDADSKLADKWVGKTMATKKAKAEKGQLTIIDTDKQ